MDNLEVETPYSNLTANDLTIDGNDVEVEKIAYESDPDQYVLMSSNKADLLRLMVGGVMYVQNPKPTEEENKGESCGESSGGNSRENNKRQLTTSDVEQSEKKVKSDSFDEELLKMKWKSLEENPTDFSTWCSILKMVDDHNLTDCGRTIYRKFLELHPLSEEFWLKYAEFEKKNNGILMCEKILRKGLISLPINVQLWVTYMRLRITELPFKVSEIRADFEKGLFACGLDFYSCQLYVDYIDFEVSQNEILRAVQIYLRLLSVPTVNYASHLKSFQNLVSHYPAHKVFGIKEYMRRRRTFLLEIRINRETNIFLNNPPITEEFNTPEFKEFVDVLLKNRLIKSAFDHYEHTAKVVNKRNTFEKAIHKRDFDGQRLTNLNELDVWKSYISFERTTKDFRRILFIFEKSLIPCAMHEDIWCDYLDYLDSNISIGSSASEFHERVYVRACFIHHPKSLKLNLKYYNFSIKRSNIAVCKDILDRMEIYHPDVTEIASCRLHLTRLYESNNITNIFDNYLESSQSMSFITFILKHYVHYHWVQNNDINSAIDVVKNTIVQKCVDIIEHPEIFLLLVKLKTEINSNNVDPAINVTEHPHLSGTDNLLKKIRTLKTKLSAVKKFLDDYDLLNNNLQYLENKINAENENRKSLKYPKL